MSKVFKVKTIRLPGFYSSVIIKFSDWVKSDIPLMLGHAILRELGLASLGVL
jgi:hypothetical protein